MAVSSNVIKKKYTFQTCYVYSAVSKETDQMWYKKTNWVALTSYCVDTINSYQLIWNMSLQVWGILLLGLFVIYMIKTFFWKFTEKIENLFNYIIQKIKWK